MLYVAHCCVLISPPITCLPRCAGENLERRGQDLHSRVQLHIYDALLGGRVSVDTPRGERMLPVPEGTQVGDVLMLKDAGVAAARQGAVEWGHHYFDVQVVVPDGACMGVLERRLLQQLASLGEQASEMEPWW